MRVCPNCSEENPDKFRLCGFCGAQLAVALQPEESRKTVSVVFCDLKGSTNLGESLDTEALREVLRHYFSRMQSVLERHGGAVEKYIGDAIMAVFGLPRAHEDDALRAVRAAWEMKQALVEVNRELEGKWGVTLANRTGVNTGEVVAGDVTAGQRLVTGDTVNVAARLEQAAPETDVLLGEPTYRLVRDSVDVEPLEPLELKGKAERVAAYRLLDVRAGEAIARRLDTPLVGRDEELATLQSRFGRAVREQHCEMVTIVGDAGVGKSRLIHEVLVKTADQATTLLGRCLPYGEGITFWPLAEIVRQAAGIGSDDGPDQARAKVTGVVDDDVSRRVIAMLGLSFENFPLEETFWGFRKFVESLGQERPVVMVIDDIHWAEPTLLELLEHLVETVRDAGVLLLCSTRHDLLEERPSWAAEQPNATRILLEPLSEHETDRVVDNLLGDAPTPVELRHRIVLAAEGNPLFVEQVLSMLLDQGLIVSGSDGTLEVSPGAMSLAIPASISALIGARLDGLAGEERAVIERGSVIGPLFYTDAIATLAPEPLRPLVHDSLSSLSRKHLIRPEVSDLIGQEAHRFHHALIRDVAYERLLKRARIELHEGYATWLERAAGTLTEFEEILGYHLEQAYRYRTELGTIDAAAREVAVRAAGPLASAGRRALSRGDMPAAANLLDRAALMLPTEDATRAGILADLGEALRELGQFVRAEEVLDEAMRAAAAMGDRRLEKQAEMVALHAALSADADIRVEDVLQRIERDLPVFEEAGDEATLARAWRLIALLHGTLGRDAAAQEAVLRAIDHARLASDARLEARNFSIYATSAVYGPTPVREGITRCEQLLENTSGDRRAEGTVRCSLAQLYSFIGDFERARQLYRQGREILSDLGSKVLGASVSIDSARVEMMAGDPVAAERELRRDYAALREMGERYHYATVAGLLAHALYLQGRYEEADEFTKVTQSGDQDDVESQSLWRRARGKLLARKGQYPEAESLIREALAMTQGKDSLVLEANTRMDLAQILELAGRPQEAASEIRAALVLYDRKGSLVSSERARQRLAELELVGPGGEASPGELLIEG
ncbi:MAG TPA: adenylate/guanylate cyclase domain-containing protein [Actinomycetota bacterium]|nr:adenylate/guanylate cyclase domain-containing protein [Actinomycetota bacterium]